MSSKIQDMTMRRTTIEAQVTCHDDPTIYLRKRMADLRLQIRTSITTREFEKGRIFSLMMINKSKEFSEGQKFYKSSAFNIQKEQKNKKYPSHVCRQ